MNTNQASPLSSLTIDNVLGTVLVAAILGACGTGIYDVVRMMASVA